MGHRDMQELLGVYALDALDDESERGALERHLETCAGCAREVEEHRATAALLATTSGPASDQVWQRILTDIGATGRPTPRVLPLRPRKAVPRQVVSALAAAAVATVALMAGQLVQAERRADRLEAALRGELTAATVRQAMEVDGSRLIALGADGGAQLAEIVLLPDGRGYLLPTSLPPLPAGQTYQLWALDREQKVSLALLGAAPAVSGFRVHGDVDGYAITVEQAPGAPQPTKTPIAVGFVKKPA